VEYKCPQEERYRGIWLGPPGRQTARPAGPYPILYNSLKSDFQEASRERDKIASYLITFFKIGNGQ